MSRTIKNDDNNILYKIIVETIRNTLDINEVKQKVVDIIGQTLNADRCFIMEYDNFTNKFLIIKDEYVSSTKTKEYAGSDVNIDVPNFINEFKKGSYLIVKDKKIYINNEPKEFTEERFAIQQYGVNSAYAVPLQFNEVFIGVLAIHYLSDKHKVNKKEIELMLNIADQIALAIYQAKLYKENQSLAEREKLLRQIIEIINSTSDILQVKQKVITEIAKTLNANRCYIAEYDENIGKHLPISQEYLASREMKSIIGFDIEKNVPELVNFVKDKPLVLIPDVDKFVEHNKFSDVVSNYFKDFDIKSRVYAQISYRDDFFGTLIVNFQEKREKFKQEDVDFIETLANQIGILMYQAKLYNNSQLQLAREKILGAILAKSISTFDINQIKPIVREVGILAKADRCYFVEAKEEELSGKQIYYDGEYLASPDIKSAIGYTFPTEDVHKFVEMYLEAKDLIVFDYEEILKNTDKQFEGMRKYINRFELKSAIGIPLFYKGKLLAVLAIEYAKEKVLPTKDELEFYRILGKQAGMVLNQIKLFETTKKTAEREKLLRIITEKIRSSLDIQKTLSYICEETAKLFNVQRAAISEMFPPYDSGKFIPRREYKINESIKGLNNVFYPKEAGAYIAETVLDKGINLVINNFEKSNTPDFLKKTYNEMGVKSALCVPIKRENKKWGTILLAEYNYYRVWTQEEVDLLETIAGQIYIAINQAELYEKEKQAVERERISRNIIEILRSSIDKKIIKKLFVRNLGKFFNADRVFFSEYDNQLAMYLPVDNDSEYLSSTNEKSFVGFDWSDPNMQLWIKPLLEKREIKIANWEEYINQGHEISDYILSLYKETNIKSKYGFPVIYQNNIMGFFCLEFTKNVYDLQDEDIERIRSICTQAGIALYHANLYQSAQQCNLSKEVFKTDLLNKIAKPTQEILDISKILSQNEYEHQVEIEYLNNIIRSCNQLLELTQNISGD